MARLWQLGSEAVRPGVYFRTSASGVTTEPSTQGIVALIYNGNWGPLNEVVDIDPEELNNLTEFVGTGNAYETARQAFIGGARMLRTVRVGSVTRTTKKSFFNLRAPGEITTRQNADGTTTTNAPPIVVRITAKYPGARKFSLTIKTNSLLNLGQMYVYDEEKRLIDSVTFRRGVNEATALVNAINTNSKYFTAKRIGTGNSRVRDLTQVGFAVGKNPAVSTESYTAGTNILERYNWNVVIADRATKTVEQVLIDFVRQCYEVGRFGMTVLCGSINSPIADRTSKATEINDWRVVYVLSGFLGLDGKKYGTYLCAARIAGMIANCESNASVTHLVIQDAVRPLEDLTNAQMIQAEQKGCVVLSPNDEGQVWLDNAINTLITLGNGQDLGWTKIRRTKCRFELMERVNRTLDRLVGRLNNDANGRATCITAMQRIINEMCAEGKLFLGSYAAEDPGHTSEGDRAYFVLYISDIDSLEKIYLDYNFSYANRYSDLDTTTTT